MSYTDACPACDPKGAGQLCAKHTDQLAKMLAAHSVRHQGRRRSWWRRLLGGGR